MSTAKKQKLNPEDEIIRQINSIEVSDSHISAAWLENALDSLKPGIRPGRGLVGTEAEEADFNAGRNRPDDDEAAGELTNETANGCSNKDEEKVKSAKREKREQLSSEIVELPNKEYHIIYQYFGNDWENMIKALHAVEPTAIPPYMTLAPHDYQLKGAAWIDFACRSLFRACLVGDGMGIGKTIQAILCMWQQRDEPGLSLVICPATLCEQWVTAIVGAFEEVRFADSA